MGVFTGTQGAGVPGQDRMKHVDEAQKQATAPAVRLNGVNNGNGQANGHSNGHSNGFNGHTIIEDSESDSDAEEVEPVSASLVLRVVSDTPSLRSQAQEHFSRCKFRDLLPPPPWAEDLHHQGLETPQVTTGLLPDSPHMAGTAQ